MSMLQVRGLTKDFGGLVAVNDVDFDLFEGQITGLIGPNGAGKTTIINMVSGFLSATRGKIQFKETEIVSLPAYKVAQLGLARTFQISQIFENFTVQENILMGTHSKIFFGLFAGIFRAPKERKAYHQAMEIAEEVMEFLELEDKRDVICGKLPYGDKRIVELGRVLAAQPALVLLDEPAAGLNTAERIRLTEVIKKIKDRGKTILFIEHDMKMVMGISDKVIVINFGEVIAKGTPEEIQKNKNVIEAYLG